MPEYEIRRIREAEAGDVVELWDRMGREVPDGGPLTEAGRRHLARMLAALAWHRNGFALVATRAGAVVAFGLGRVDDGDGLLPDAFGEIQEVYVPADLAGADELRHELAAAVMARLRERGVTTLRKTVASDDPADREFWAGRGFEVDMVVMSMYE